MPVTSVVTNHVTRYLKGKKIYGQKMALNRGAKEKTKNEIFANLVWFKS